MSWLRRFFGGGTPPAPPPAPAPLPEFPYPLAVTTGANALNEWRRYQLEWRKEGCSAVLLGDANEVAERAASIKEASQAPAEFLASAATIKAPDFFATRAQQFTSDETDLPDDEWPAKLIPPAPLTAHKDLASGRPKPVVFFAKVPTPHAWEIPAYLRAGGWNDCPDAASQVAVLRYWSENHGIEIYACTPDMLECVASRPPQTQPEARALAREQFYFCSDIVHQGTERLSVLAAALLKAENWFFWWD